MYRTVAGTTHSLDDVNHFIRLIELLDQQRLPEARALRHDGESLINLLHRMNLAQSKMTGARIFTDETNG